MDSVQLYLHEMKGSHRVTERRSAAQNLETYLQQNTDDICEKLDVHSVVQDKSGRMMTWNNLFNEVEGYFMKETEKGNPGNFKGLYFSIVKTVFTKATRNRHRPLLKWDIVYDFLTTHLRKERYVIIYGPNLMNMLECFLSIETYQELIDACSWQELLKLLIKCYEKHGIMSGTVLNCLKICIAQGSLFGDVIPELRNGVVKFYRDRIIADPENKLLTNYLSILDGLTILCQKNACESRNILCKLGETVIPRLLPSNASTEEDEAALVEFLLIQYSLHMPCDVDVTSDAFYASDPPTWIEVLRSMYSHCIDTIEGNANRKNKPNDVKFSDKLLVLAAKCTKQISSPSLIENDTSEGEDDRIAPKKTMRYKSLGIIVSDLLRKPITEGYYIWLRYLSSVLTNFPELVDTKVEYSNLVSIGCNLFKSVRNTARPEFYSYFMSLLKVEKCMRESGTLTEVTDVWSSVWDFTIKSIHISQDKPGACALLRQIMKEIRPSNLMSLLSLFLNNSMPMEKDSVQLLAEFLSLCTVPVQMMSSSNLSQSMIVDEEIAVSTSSRLALIKWLLKVSSSEIYANEQLLAAVMCSLVVKQSHALILEEVDLSQSFHMEYVDFEHYLLKTCFVKMKPTLTESTKKLNSKMSHFKYIVEESLAHRLVQALQMDLESLPRLESKLAVLEPRGRYSKFMSKLSLYMNILNIMEKHSIGISTNPNVEPEPHRPRFLITMEKVFTNGVHKCNNFIAECFVPANGIRGNPEYLKHLIESTRVLYRTSDQLCERVRCVLSQSSLEAVAHIKKAFRSNLARHIERGVNNEFQDEALLIIDQELPSRLRMMQQTDAADLDIITRSDRRYEAMSMTALLFLIDYGLICGHQSNFFDELMKDLCEENFRSPNQFLFDACTEVIMKLPKVLLDSSPPDTVNLVSHAVGLLQKCCRGFFVLPNCAGRLWDMFKEMTPVVAPIDNQSRTNFMILVGTSYTFLKRRDQRSPPRHVSEKAFLALAELAKYDPSLTWTKFKPSNGASMWILEDLHESIRDRSQLVRMWAVDTICAVYENALPYDYSGGINSSQGELSASGRDTYQDRRKVFLDELYKELVNVYDVSTNLREDENIEEIFNRTSTVLSCLTRLLFAFPYTQKQVVIFLFLIVKLKTIDVSLTKRALDYASPSAVKTMCCYLSYVLKKTLQLKQDVKDFPYQLFGCNTMDSFLGKFRNDICVELFEHNEMDELKSIAQRLNLTVDTLVEQCYGLIMARVTPALAILHYQLRNPQNLRLPHYNEVHKRLIETIGGKDKTDTLLATYLGDVVLNIISLMFEPSVTNSWKCLKIQMTEPVPPHHPEGIIEKSLEFLQSISPHSNLSVIGYLANMSHESIYKILLCLTVRIHDAHDEFERYWRLHQFSFFVNLLLKEPPGIFSSMKEYVCNFVFNTFLRLLKTKTFASSENSVRFQKVIVQLIMEVVEKVTYEYVEEMKVFFNPIVRGIVSAADKCPQLVESSKHILDFLLKTHAETFGEYIESLDPFPSNIPEFHEYSLILEDRKYGNRKVDWPLAKEFDRVVKEPGEYCTKERLKFLRELLVTRKRDLDRMVRNLESKRFSDDCATDPLHNIIRMLIGIAISPHQDQELILEACRCLGEIGPIDLSVLVLHPHRTQGEISHKDVALHEIIKLIAGYLTSDDIRLVTAAGKVLRALLQFEECLTIIREHIGDTRLSKLLLPFQCNTRMKQFASDKIDSTMLEQKLGLNEMNEGIDYRSWLTNLTKAVIECFNSTSFIPNILPMCELRVDFCETVFPYVVYRTLYSGRTNINVKRTLGGYFRNFFTQFTNRLMTTGAESSRSFTPSSFGTPSATIYMNKLALRSLIRVIQFLRQHEFPQEMKGKQKTTPWDSNFWMDSIIYLDVARAAQYCGAYLTSILYIEIAATQLELTSGSQDLHDSQDDSQEEFYSQNVSIRNRSEAAKIEKMLLKAYSSIGEADAVYGCGSARFSDVESSMHHMEQTMNWHRLLMLANGSYVAPESCMESYVALSVKQLGLYNVLWGYLKGVESLGTVQSDELSHIQYECGWRLMNWDLNTEKPAYIKEVIEPTTKTHSTFQMCIYESIRNGLVGDAQSHLEAVKNGFKSVRSELKHASLESSENVYGFLSRLQMLRVVEDFFEKSSESEVDAFIQKWKLHDKVPTGGFKYQEPALFLRNVLLRAYDQTKNSSNLDEAINASLLELIGKARDAGQIDFAESCASAMASLSNKTSIPRELEVAKNNWACGRQDLARDILNKLIKKCSTDDSLYPSLLLLYGDWLSISHCERPSVILDKYLQKSCNLYENRKSNNPPPSVHEVSNAYIVLAKYADGQYQNVTKYISSDVFQDKVNLLRKARERELLLQNSVDKESKMSVAASRRQSTYDEEEIKFIQKQQKDFLELALKHYLRGLKTSGENDLLIFRAISLWLENEDGQMDSTNSVDKTTQIFGIEKMPTYKYIVVLHQLSARLSKERNARNALLKEILIKCAEDHPFHTLPVLLTQASLHKDEKLPGRSSLKVQMAARVDAAAEIVNTLKGVPKLKKMVSRMDALWMALIELANTQEATRNTDGVKKNISSDIMKRLKDLEMVAVPTSTIPVLQSGNYKDSVVYIKEFENVYGLVGGINSPKKIRCRGSNGIWYNMLLKGQDDLRQDAVMQQVFSVMNKLLQLEPKTRSRRLHIRTYKVVPLSQRTGVIEWVENTQTLGEYLTGNGRDDKGAHVRYRPNDYEPMLCRRMMMDARTKDAMQKYTTYANICENFKPVFRHFFLENFKEAGMFFEKRLAYTRSVATNSIVGYILGLGDRHVLNILIDKTTAEFVHIDLGIAFEYGRVLPTPETVPFRLTRDVVDGMGVSGVEGVFKRSCEMTMEVLRNNAEIIITVLQVLLYDPLYSWALTNDRVAKVQPSDSSRNGRKSNAVEQTEDSATERNNSAMRVLLRLRQKLMGIEEEGGATGAISSGCSLSINGHVALLIQRAMDPDKLCRLFPGWQPYL